MKRLLLVILVVLGQATAAGAQSVQGHVADAATGQAVPFVNIGVVGKDLGTVANEQGAYQLPFREALANDTVRVSSIGYRARLLTLRALQAQPNVALTAADVTLGEVQVQAKSLFRRTSTLGHTTNSTGSVVHLNNKSLGAEVGTVISLKRKPTRLLTAHFNVASNAVGPLVLRVNLYRLDRRGRPTDTKLLSHNLIVQSGITHGTLDVDLTREQLVVDENFFLALEWIKGDGAEAPTRLPPPLKTTVHQRSNGPAPPRTGLAFSAGAGYVDNDLYVRTTSQGAWERATVGARLAGMQPYLSFFVTAQD